MKSIVDRSIVDDPGEDRRAEPALLRKVAPDRQKNRHGAKVAKGEEEVPSRHSSLPFFWLLGALGGLTVPFPGRLPAVELDAR
ncbi:hypothetical protein ACSRUE_14965 [Sorangium sp. KYC3313]|uniref:hypothetical protein n=1 Tax=Sorangium sp. KYC3313 TaxID=3449740 RepID=UPI003F895B13